jgi:hypothetical protein
MKYEPDITELKTLAKECGAEVTDYIDYVFAEEVVLFPSSESLLKFFQKAHDDNTHGIKYWRNRSKAVEVRNDQLVKEIIRMKGGRPLTPEEIRRLYEHEI